MKVVFRVDASTDIGSGHVMRCLVLAKELLERGYCIEFACLPISGNMNAHIAAQGFRVIELSPPNSPTKLLGEADYKAWLQRSALEDAKDFINNISGVDMVITDHYAIDFEWQRFVKNAFGCKIVAIDDLTRTHDAELLIDQTLGREPSSYPSVSRALTGSEYALLNPLFCQSRVAANSRKLPKGEVNVVVSMGGVDKPNTTLLVLRAIAELPSLSICVLLSPRAPHYSEVKAFCQRYHHITHIDFVCDMAGLMLRNDIAIGAPGTTSWERACLGLPNIIIPLADNQAEISKQLVLHDASILVHVSEISEKLGDCIETLMNNWFQYHKNNLRLCDGFGVFRVVTEIERVLRPELFPVFLVNACENDISLVYQWQCHPDTRKYSLNPSVPTFEQHTQWMKNKLREANDFFYMMVNREGKKVGVVRLDSAQDQTYLVSVYVAPNAYGKGYATFAMKLLDKLHPYSTITARVLKDNCSSQRLFEKLQYNQIDPENFIRTPVK